MSARPSTAPRSPSGTPAARTPAATTPAKTPAGPDAVTDMVRWAAFCCVLVPVVLVVYGASLAGAAGTALGLAAVTGVCRVLLRRSERGAVRLRAGARTAHQMRHDHVRHGRAGSGDRRGGRHAGGNTPVD